MKNIKLLFFFLCCPFGKKLCMLHPAHMSLAFQYLPKPKDAIHFDVDCKHPQTASALYLISTQSKA